VSIVNREATISVPNGWSGSRAITFTATDPEGLSSSDAATFTVRAPNLPPVAHNDSYATNEDENLVVVAPGVLNNDADPEGQAIAATLVATTRHGTLALQSDGSFTYTPQANFFGPDTFTYTATDGAMLSATAIACINVTPVNDAPVVSGLPRTVTTEPFFPPVSLDWQVSDVDNIPSDMTWSHVRTPGSSGVPIHYNMDTREVTSPFDLDSWCGADTVIFTATDPGGLTGRDTLIFVKHKAPKVVDIQNQTVVQGQSFAAILLDNHVMPFCASPEQLVWHTEPVSGRVSATVSADRIATVTAPPGWAGTDQIAFWACNPVSGLCDYAYASFTVTPSNQPPVVSGIPDQTINEDQQFSDIYLDNFVVDGNDAAATIAWTVSGADSLRATIVNRVLSVAIPRINWFGADTLCR